MCSISFFFLIILFFHLNQSSKAESVRKISSFQDKHKWVDKRFNQNRSACKLQGKGLGRNQLKKGYWDHPLMQDPKPRWAVAPSVLHSLVSPKCSRWGCWLHPHERKVLKVPPSKDESLSPGVIVHLKAGYGFWGLHRWCRGKESACQCRRHRRQQFDPWFLSISESPPVSSV